MKIVARYNFTDDYKNRKFAATEKRNPENFKQLVKLADVIKTRYPTQYNPIYHNKEKGYVSIQTKSNFKFEEESVYEFDLQLGVRKYNDVDYLNVLVKNPKLVESGYKKLSLKDFLS
jgi:hypothetical protein